jgi:hypothetical protein
MGANLDNSQYLIPGFLPDGNNLLLPEGTYKVYDDTSGKWALYICELLNCSWIVHKARYFDKIRRINILGWRVRLIPYIAKLEWYQSYVKDTCNECLGLKS